MKITIDTEQNTLVYDENGQQKVLELYTKEAFELISSYWVKIG